MFRNDAGFWDEIKMTSEHGQLLIIGNLAFLDVKGRQDRKLGIKFH